MRQRRTMRTLFAFTMFLGLFAAAVTLALPTISPAAHDGNQAAQQPKSADQPKPEQPPPAKPGIPEFKDMRPDGPDDWFTPLPADGLFKGSQPKAFYKAVILETPFEDSWNDEPVADLPSGYDTGAWGLRMYLEQYFDYLPNVYQYLPETDAGAFLARARRYQAKLRFSDAPRPRKAPQVGAKSSALEAAAKSLGADFVFAISYARPTAADEPCRALCVRYARGRGVQVCVEIALPKPSETVLADALPAAVEQLCAGIANDPGPEGKQIALPMPPVPRLATTDKALLLQVQIRKALEKGEITRAWIDLEALRKLEPLNGRSAMHAVEIFRLTGDQQQSFDERNKYLAMVISAGREGLKTSPNDVLLRGKLCRYVTLWYKRDDWALRGLDEALGVQPCNAHALNWRAMIEFALDRQKQAQWTAARALPLLADGRGEYLMGNVQFNSALYADAAGHYRKAIALRPDEYEFHFGLGLVCTYLAERLDKSDLPGPEGVKQRDQALDAFIEASKALVAAQRLDPTELGWPYEYHVRAGTFSFKRIPGNPDTLDRVMLSQAVVNALQPTSKTAKWDALVEPVQVTWRRLMRASSREAKSTEPDYEIWLIARLRFAQADDDDAEIKETLRIMRRFGHRSDLYKQAMATWGPLLDGKAEDKPG